MKKTVVFDFDGVIHSYISGWQGADKVSDPPVPGIREAIAEIRAAGYEVIVVSTRCATPEGYGAVRAWLIDHEIVVDDVKTEKPPAIVYIDDRAICFDGHPENLLGRIKSFKPWNNPSVTNADRIRCMSDEELAWELMTWRCEAVARHHGAESQYPNTQKTILSWLQQPVEEVQHEICAHQHSASVV